MLHLFLLARKHIIGLKRERVARTFVFLPEQAASEAAVSALPLPAYSLTHPVEKRMRFHETYQRIENGTAAAVQSPRR